MPQNLIPFWKEMPVLRILVPLVIGIVIEKNYDFPVYIGISIFGACLILQIIFVLLPFLLRIRLATIQGIMVNIFFITAGWLIARQNNIAHTVKSLYHFQKTTAIVVVTLEEKPVKKTQYYKSLASVDYEIRDSLLFPLNGKLFVYFNNTGLPCTGDQLIIKGILQKIPASNNPGEFDYAQYARMQGISHQFVAGSIQYSVIRGVNKRKIGRFLENSRERINSILQTFIPDKRNAGLAEALLIGYRNDLDKDLIQSYSNTGVVHIIAISGLHIGLIYYLLLLLFKPLKRMKSISRLSPLFIVLGLWVFTLLAGAQPSILRSTVMFTFIILGQVITRKPIVFNSLCLSAFLLLCYNPNWLWDIGFQLSYLALTGILVFSRPIYNCLYFPNKLIDAIWQLNAVTIAAQILTTPICIFYFHQFPVYFLASNLIAVPLSSIILVLEIVLCVFSFMPVSAGLFGMLVNWLLTIMNNCIRHIEQLPFAIWQGFQINVWQTIFLSLLAILFTDWLLYKRKSSFIAGYSVFTICIFIHIYTTLEVRRQRRIIVYKNRKENIVEYIQGKIAYQYRDSATWKGSDPQAVTHRLFCIGEIISLEKMEQQVVFHRYGNKGILLISGAASFPAFTYKPRVDLLVLSGKARINFPQFAERLEIRQVIAAGNLPYRTLDLIRDQCDSLGIKFHDVNKQAAFVMNLR